jgi:hypothetical protein
VGRYSRGILHFEIRATARLYVVMMNGARPKIPDIACNVRIMPLYELTLDRRISHTAEGSVEIWPSQTQPHREIDRFGRLICGCYERKKYALKMSLNFDARGKWTVGSPSAQAPEVILGDLDLRRAATR